MSLYRITLSGSLSEAWNSKHAPSGGKEVQRIYRWEKYWGILSKNEWRVETREPILTSPYLLEKVMEHDIQAPPPTIDDVWEEEILKQEKAVWNGSILSICLPGSEMKSWCKKELLEIPECLSSIEETSFGPSNLVKHPNPNPNSNKVSKPKPNPNPKFSHTHVRKCYIED